MLRVSNTIIFWMKNCKYKNVKFTISFSGLSPTAASVSRLIKSGLTVTEIYTQYVSVMDELASEKQESARLKSYITQIVHEIEEKGPLLKKQREDYENALETVSELTKRNDELVMEIQNLRETCLECKRLEG